VVEQELEVQLPLLHLEIQEDLEVVEQELLLVQLEAQVMLVHLIHLKVMQVVKV
jgi:hypothetical protein